MHNTIALEPKKVLTTIIITLFLSLFLQGLADTNLFSPSNWKLTTWVNLLHLWLTFLSSYYLYSFLLTFGIKKFKPSNTKNNLLLLATVQLLVFIWIISTDIAFYFGYYNIKSLTETTFYEFDVPLAIAVLTIGSIYFYQKQYTKPISQHYTKDTENYQKIEAFAGKSIHLLNTAEIGVFYLADGIIWIEMLNGKTFHTNNSLSKLNEILSSKDFFRLNRQTIVSRKAIKGFEKLTYQKLQLLLIDEINFNSNLVISKYNAPIFKKWLTNST